MKIFCRKLQREGEQLPRKPIPGALGDRIFNEISRDAWDLWLKQQTMLLNEYRLSSFEPETQQFLRERMEAFLFNDEQVSPSEYREI
ncbi:MAG: oxidative damage protection protein [Cardiobacteriaceae bacterium]|nr:oxidative damage protection protein [Cardiobacteriaceae bacterium]